MTDRDTTPADVVIVGGGLAGLATAIHLARAGRAVQLIDDRSRPAPTLGESLEFTAPGFLQRLGIERDGVAGRGLGHAKTNVLVANEGDPGFEIWPPGWFGRAPFFCSNATMHIDRSAVDDELRCTAGALGVEILDDRVVRVDVGAGAGSRAGADDGRVAAVVTATGRRLTAGWFVDATGCRTRLLGRALSLPWRTEGVARLATFARLDAAPVADVTSLRFSPARSDDRSGTDDLTWGWVIPIADDAISVGVCQPADAARPTNAGDRGEPLRRFVSSVPELAEVAVPADAEVVAYTPGTHRRTSGRNWIMVGDAAGLVDPLTSSGVAAALRGAETAAALIGSRPRTPGRALARAHHHQATVRTVTAANTVIDRLLFRPGLRRLIGHRLAVFAFAAPVLVMHAWYVRARRYGTVGLGVHATLTTVVRGLATAIGLVSGRPPQRPVPADRTSLRPAAAQTSRAIGGDRSRTADRSA